MVFFCAVVLVFGVVENVNAALWDRGNVLIYDDVLDFTWLQDANYAQTSDYDDDGILEWQEALDWADQLVYGGYDDWMLGLPSHYSYMYSQNMGGTAGIPDGDDMTGDHTVGNVTIFNIQDSYWTCLEYNYDSAQIFSFRWGAPGFTPKNVAYLVSLLGCP